MLNISSDSKRIAINRANYPSINESSLMDANKMFVRWLVGVFILLLIFLFLPWTQNIQSKGKVTTLQPGQRPQTIHSTISGRIEQWYVREGEFVKAGDTIVYLSEIKSEYFDPELVEKTKNQVNAKRSGYGAYQQKVLALDRQIEAMKGELAFKRSQLTNKVKQVELKIAAQKIAFEAAQADFGIAETQFKRIDQLYQKGLKSLTEWEQKRLKVQQTKAKLIDAENKLGTNENELENARISLQAVETEYANKIAKSESEKFSTLSQQYDTESTINKLAIEYENYLLRSQFYYITAPQDCYVTQALTPGIGETIKEGDAIVRIMPADYQLAVELFVRPMDIPLIQLEDEVRFIFDGWPAFVFSGWPGNSFGTYSGKVSAVDYVVDANGEARVLVGADDSAKPWPDALRPGSGASGIVLLNTVPIWYEIWRQLNAFPPDYYDTNEELPKLKAPIKSVK